MGVAAFLKFQALASAMSQVEQLTQKAEAFVVADYEKAKAEITEALEHFKAEVARLRGEVDPLIVAHIDAGADPHAASQLAAAGVPAPALAPEAPAA
jgi:NAD-specific glutamate dehydrogenase